MVQKMTLGRCEMGKKRVDLTEQLEILFLKTEQGNPKAKNNLAIFLQQIDAFEKSNKTADDC